MLGCLQICVTTPSQYCGETSVAISCVIVRLSICVCLKRPEEGGGGHPNDRALTGCKHLSNLFYLQRKEKPPSPIPPAFFFPVPPPHRILPLSSCSSHFPPTLHPCMVTHLPHQLQCWLCFIVVQHLAGKPRLEWGRGLTLSEHWGVAVWMPRKAED